MKNLSRLVLGLAFVAVSATAAPVHLKLRPVPIIPSVATTQYAHYSSRLTANGRLRVAQLASQLAEGSLDPSRVDGIAKVECIADLVGCNGGADTAALAFIVMMQATKSAQDDLESIMDGVEAITKQKAKARAMQATLNALADVNAQQLNAKAGSFKNRLDSLSEMGETESLRLQMAMDRMSKFMQMLSNLEKKLSDTESGIIQNLK